MDKTMIISRSGVDRKQREPLSGAEILVVEDDQFQATLLTTLMHSLGAHVTVVDDGDLVLKKLEQQSWDLVFLDYMLPGRDGLQLLPEIKKLDSELPILFVTAESSVENAVLAMQAGASDFLTKPLTRAKVVHRARTLIEKATMSRRIESLQATIRNERRLEGMTAMSASMKKVANMVGTVAASKASTMLLLGESGVGKNLVARLIHENSARSEASFQEVTCTAIPESMLESTLFGHERGAFTDARDMRKGYCELAQGGTLFLDEIGDMPLGMQAKLLGFLENRRFRRLGGTRDHESDLRVIAATNHDLAEKVNLGEFRPDLYYRLNVIGITIPPLRERQADLPGLIEFFIGKYNELFGKRVRGITEGLNLALKDYAWPGNVRELRNMIERAMIMSQNDQLDLEDFPLNGPRAQSLYPESDFSQAKSLNLFDHEARLIREALNRTSSNQTRAATLLGITRNQLVYRLKKFPM